MKTYRVKVITQSGMSSEVQIKAGNSAVARRIAEQTYPQFRIAGVLGEVKYKNTTNKNSIMNKYEIKYQIGNSGTMNKMVVSAMNSSVARRNFNHMYPNAKIRGVKGPL